MGIERNVASAIVKEHAWKPIRGDVLLLGRQTMFFPPKDAIALLKESALPIPDIQFQKDDETRQASSHYIRDDDFFRLLGVDRVKALDVSPYEGAEIIHDLTKPIPDSLERSADFILDGSTLDNVFDPATALRNISRLLKPGGRLLAVNLASNHYSPYTIQSGSWFLDYFAVNHFSDCKVYATVYSSLGVNFFTPDLSKLQKSLPQVTNVESPHVMGWLVLAEKGLNSTWDKTPVQHQYRSDWDDFNSGLKTIRENPRPDHVRSTTECFRNVPGYFFVDQDGKRHPAKTGFITRAMAKLRHELRV